MNRAKNIGLNFVCLSSKRTVEPLQCIPHMHQGQTVSRQSTARVPLLSLSSAKRNFCSVVNTTEGTSVGTLRAEVYTPSHQEAPDDTDLEALCVLARKEMEEHRCRSVLEPPVDLRDIDDVRPPLGPTFDVAHYANRSSTLQRLAVLGVQLSAYNKNLSKLRLVAPMDFERDIVPTLRWLERHGLDMAQMAHILTENPRVLLQSEEDLTARVDYLTAKNFPPEAFPRIFSKHALWLTTSLASLDTRLGFLQSHFSLSGEQVRAVVLRRPSAVFLSQNRLRDMDLMLKEEFEFTLEQRQRILVENPMLYEQTTESVQLRLRLLTNKMQLPLAVLVESNRLLTCHTHILAGRHFFLKALGRAQYDPCLPLYVSLQLMCEADDGYFASVLAESSLADFDRFLHDV